MFPHGRALLDSWRVVSALADVDGVLDPQDGRLQEVHYLPHARLLTVHQLDDGRLVAIEAVPAGAPLQPEPGQYALRGLSALARVLPDDPESPQLAAVLAEIGPGADVLKWLPGDRAVVADASRVARMNVTTDVPTVHRWQCDLWKVPDRAVPIPAPLTAEPDRGVRWEARVAGDGVESVLWQVSPDRLAMQTAMAAAGLHRCLPSMVARSLPLPSRGSCELVKRARRKTARTVQQALPDLVPQYESVVGVLLGTRPQPRPSVLVHGDLHVANTLMSPTGLVLLDLDWLGHGEPELDLAMFASRLLLVAMHRGEGLAEAAVFAEVLPRLYAEVAQRPVPAWTYAWYLAASLASRQVKDSIRHLTPQLRVLCGELLDLADRILRARKFSADLVVPMALHGSTGLA
jgi:aminoglycoside phosphotransferase (APT) family kinase protein